jgi:hypothetical protein
MIFNAITEAQFLVAFDKFGSFLFTEKSGGDWEAETSEVPNGSGMDIYNVVGPRKVTPVTLKAPFDPTLQAQLDPIIMAWSCDFGVISVTPVNCQGEVGTSPDSTNISLNISGVTAHPVGAPYIYTGCRLKKYTVPKIDRKSGTAAMIELEFVVNKMSRQGSGSYKASGNTSTSTPASSSTLKSIQDLLKSSNIA